MNARRRGLGTFEDDVFHFLHVDFGHADCIQHARQHAGAIEMTGYQGASRGSGAREVDHVRPLAGL